MPEKYGRRGMLTNYDTLPPPLPTLLLLPHLQGPERCELLRWRIPGGSSLLPYSCTMLCIATTYYAICIYMHIYALLMKVCNPGPGGAGDPGAAGQAGGRRPLQVTWITHPTSLTFSKLALKCGLFDSLRKSPYSKTKNRG